MRVLMVDDDGAYLSACATILRTDGHDVVTCSDFHEGRRRLAQDRFDALITDVRLGAFNGLHLIALAAPSMITNRVVGHFSTRSSAETRNRPERGSS
jgi:DNA-binding response OmpR family regulator